jgi:glc operon protein GlcG
MRSNLAIALLAAACAAAPVAASLAAAPAAAQAAPASKRVLTVAQAKAVVAAAAAEAKRLAAPGGAIAVADDGGALIVLERLEGTFPAAAAISAEKARTAAVFRRPTAVFESAINGGRAALLGNPVLMPLQGGVPLELDGQVVGAVGVAGAASAEQDTEIATAAAAALK